MPRAWCRVRLRGVLHLGTCALRVCVRVCVALPVSSSVLRWGWQDALLLLLWSRVVLRFFHLPTYPFISGFVVLCSWCCGAVA
jgi:hypothetical protein